MPYLILNGETSPIRQPMALNERASALRGDKFIYDVHSDASNAGVSKDRGNRVNLCTTTVVMYHPLASGRLFEPERFQSAHRAIHSPVISCVPRTVRTHYPSVLVSDWWSRDGVLVNHQLIVGRPRVSWRTALQRQSAASPQFLTVRRPGRYSSQCSPCLGSYQLLDSRLNHDRYGR